MRENWHLIPAGKTLAPVAASFYELMTAPTTKVMIMMMMMMMMMVAAASFYELMTAPTTKVRSRFFASSLLIRLS